MKKSYCTYLPRNYFDNIFVNLKNYLTRGQNVLASVIYGCGENTFFDFFSDLAKRDKLFGRLYFYDPTIEKSNIVKFVGNIPKNNLQKLVIVRFFEKIRNKMEVLEKLNSIRRPNPEKLVFLIISNHEAVSKPTDYFASTSQFFSGRIYINPFDLKQSKTMININNRYYGWNIRPELVDEIFQLSGGVPRLIKHISKNIHEKNASIDDLSVFVSDASILFQLRYLTSVIVNNTKPVLMDLKLLNEKGRIRSKLLDYYFKTYRSETITDIYPNLSNLEQKTLTYLFENEGKIVSIDTISGLLEESGLEFSLWALYKLISRIRPKVKNNFKLRSVKGKGYILEKSS